MKHPCPFYEPNSGGWPVRSMAKCEKFGGKIKKALKLKGVEMPRPDECSPSFDTPACKWFVSRLF